MISLQSSGWHWEWSLFVVYPFTGVGKGKIQVFRYFFCTKQDKMLQSTFERVHACLCDVPQKFCKHQQWLVVVASSVIVDFLFFPLVADP